MQNQTSTRSVVKNTLYLYVRMIVVTLVSLYTSRITLGILGVEDFGLYTVVAGFISIFSALVNMMTGTTQRYITFELGCGNMERLNQVFSLALTIHLILAAIFFVIAETFGLWYVTHKLIVPIDRVEAVQWTYQFAVLSVITVITQVPYNSMIIAYERMKVFATISIVEVALKLGLTAVLLLCKSTSFDILIIYAGLMFCSSLIIRILYVCYSVRNIAEAKFHFYWDSKTFKSMMSFASWNMYSTFSYIAINQYIPLLLNRFFGVIVNAAMGIANQVSGLVYSFVSNFQMAFKPQIVKLYAQGEYYEMNKLINLSSKFSFIIMFVVSYPLIMCMEYVLKIWLDNVPDYTSVFCKLTVIYGLLDSLVIPLYTAIEATGRIRTYQLIVGTFFLLYVPLSYILLKNGYSPQSIMSLKIIMSIIIMIMRLKIVKSLIKEFCVSNYLWNVVVPVIGGCIVPILVYCMMPFQIERFYQFVIVGVIYFIVGISSSFYIMLTTNERSFVLNTIKHRFLCNR